MAFLGVSAGPGEAVFRLVPVGEAADGSVVTLPVAILRGLRPGPTLYLQAGLHGDEMTGIDICRQALARLQPSDLSGTVACVPLANPVAHRSRTRGAVHEERWPIDANRVFPGSPAGLMTERLVHLLFSEFIAEADLTLDLHSALDGCTIAPFVYIDPDDAASSTFALREAAGLAFGTRYVYYKGRGQKLGTSDMSGSLRNRAEAAGHASLSAEMGESRRVTAEFVPIGLRGIENILRHLRILEGDPVRGPRPRVFRSIALHHASRGGGLRFLVELEDEVRAGDPIAQIVDVFGHTVETIEASCNGFVLRKMLLGSVATGAEVAWIAS